VELIGDNQAAAGDNQAPGSWCRTLILILVAIAASLLGNDIISQAR